MATTPLMAMIAAANTLTWPGAFAIVGVAFAVALCAVAMFWCFTRI